MKKVLFVLFISVLFLVACSSEEEVTAEKKTEMTKEETLEHLEQITYRLVEAWEAEDGSFEQRSSLQAAKNREESVMQEMEEEYEDIAITEEFKDVASHVRLATEEGLDEKYLMIEIHLSLISEIIEDIPYLDGELPPSLRDNFYN